MSTVFWCCCMLIVYTYLGYPVLIRLLAWLKPRPTKVAAITPQVTIIVPAYNEQKCIRRKIEDVLSVDYPRDRLNIIIASDGSTDETVNIAREFESFGVKVIHFPERLGKKEILNRVVPQAFGEIVVANDASSMLERDSLRQMVRHFADAEVGCVTGRHVCVLQDGSAASLGESLYRRYEAWIKALETQVHSCMGGHGLLYAVRRSVFPKIEAAADDFYVPMKIIAATGLRTIYEHQAICEIAAAAKLEDELKRKIRTKVQFLRMLFVLRELLLPWRTAVWWQYVSHHVVRVFVPLAMLGALLSSLSLARHSEVYLVALWAQLIFYFFAGVGFILSRWGLRPKIFYLPFYFVFTNLAVALSAVQFWFDKYEKWERTERLPISD